LLSSMKIDAFELRFFTPPHFGLRQKKPRPWKKPGQVEIPLCR